MPEATATGTERVARAFAGNGKRAALMPYLMGGFPDLAGSLRAGQAFADAGADLLEVGVPFSDPLADGPAIQVAGQRALEAGATFEAVVEQVAAPLGERVPVALMAYANQLYARGLDAVAGRLGELGIAALIVPDMPAEEAEELRAACDGAGVALVPLLAPTTSTEAIGVIGAAARGFVYVVSVTGVTGERAELPPGLAETVSQARSAATVPVAVGFGIGTPEQAARVGEIADGVIVGSRLVRAIAEAPTLEQGLSEATDFLQRAAKLLS
jgi:tryptophan synthase alpha chain